MADMKLMKCSTIDAGRPSAAARAEADCEDDGEDDGDAGDAAAGGSTL